MLIDYEKVQSRKQDTINLFQRHNPKTALRLFRQKYKSHPTPQEFQWAKIPYVSLPKHVYIITDDEYIKVGISNHVPTRLAGLQTSNPRPLRIVLVLPYADAGFESYLHRQYAQHRVKGEG